MSALYSTRLDKRNFELEFAMRAGPENFAELGEITGDQLMYNNIDQGMPVRGNFTPNKNDKKTIQDNVNMDFDLFDKKSNFKVNYYDPMSDMTNNVARLNNVKSLHVINNDIEKMSNNIDEYGYFLFNNVMKYSLKNHILIASFNLNIILTSLYIASKNKSLLELKNYLNLSEKQKCMSDINMFYSEFEKLSYCNLTNFILAPYDFKINKTFINYLECIKILNYEDKYSNLENECLKINTYISNHHKTDFSNTIKPHHLKENSILALISGKIEPMWGNNFDEVIRETFLSYRKREQNFILARNKNYYHSTYNNMELIEMRTYDNKMSFGIIISNGDSFPIISSECVNHMIDNLVLTKFKYLMIPQINDKLKFRYTNVLKESGLNRIFNSLDIPELISNNNIYLNDIVMNIHLVIDRNKQSYNNIEKPIAAHAKKINTPFIYYLRLNTMNTILCMGQYC